MKAFASRIIRWQQRHGRHTLPWQGSRDPYRVWLSEVMLQQTQVSTVIPYFSRFIDRFPDVAALAAAPQDDVLALWSGLGYYSRARNLHAAAGKILADHAGRFPDTADALARLPGIGRSTAAAIAALAFGQRSAILDGNVRRVLARHGGIEGRPGDKRVEAVLWKRAEALLPNASIEAYTQGMMDLGAMVCTRSRPVCGNCPVASDCFAHARGLAASLPAPRPTKVLPEKHVQMLLLTDRGELMLEKRPSRGIWGGMWSLPELAPDANPVSHCRDEFGLAARSAQELPGSSHGFTHFRLHIRPVRLEIAQRQADHPGRIWLSPDDAIDAAVPAPIRKLLKQLGQPR